MLINNLVMNKGITTLIIVIIILIGAILLLRSGSTTVDTGDENATTTSEMMEGEAMELSGSGTYEVEASASEAMWRGEKPLLNQINEGTIAISSGTVVIEEGMVVRGDLVFDASSISTTILHNDPVDGNEGLEGHLKGEDFFNAEEYSEITFDLTRAEKQSGMNYMFTGDLAVKDITKEITFPAEVSMDKDGHVMILAEITLDRTDFDIKFGSGSFFEDLGDNVIADEFTVAVSVVAADSDHMHDDSTMMEEDKMEEEDAMMEE